MPKYKFMISGGGTGGHIFPAISIADELKKRFPDAQFLFVGARDRMEMERVPQAGYPVEGLWISGIQRKLSASNLMFPFKIFSSLIKCRRLIRDFAPDAVIGTGGFASGPLLYAAAQKNIPTLIQEQNSYAGITNKILAPKVNKVCVAYDKMERFFPAEKIVFTGNPIRENIKTGILKREAALESLGLNKENITLLILGGSLGARKINELVSSGLETILGKGMNIIWQTGKLYYEEIREKFRHREGEQLTIRAFLQNMNEAYGAADIVISRAGAGTISELAVVQKAAILIPSPNVAEDHQTKNALSLVEKDAAYLFRETDEEDLLLKQLERLTGEGERSKLEANISKLAKPDAAEEIAGEIVKLIENAG